MNVLLIIPSLQKNWLPSKRSMQHYSSVCKNKKSRVRIIKEEKEEQQFLGSVTLENVYAVWDDTTNWQIKVKVTTKLSIKTLNFKFRCRRDCSPKPVFQNDFPIIQPTSKRLYRSGHHEIKVIGSEEATLDTEKPSSQHLYVALSRDYWEVRQLKPQIYRK